MRQKSDETIVVKEHAIRLVRRADSQYWQAHYNVNVVGIQTDLAAPAIGTNDINLRKFHQIK